MTTPMIAGEKVEEDALYIVIRSPALTDWLCFPEDIGTKMLKYLETAWAAKSENYSLNDLSLLKTRNKEKYTSAEITYLTGSEVMELYMAGKLDE